MSKLNAYKLHGNQKYLFYCTNGRLQLQISWYKMFIERKGLSVQQLVDCINEFKNRYFSYSNKPKDILDACSRNFDDFVAIVSEKTGVTLKKKSNRHNDWDAEWHECNLDGTFAYNGVTEDF